MAADFGWVGEAWASLGTPRGRADFLFAVETAMSDVDCGWRVSIDQIPAPGKAVAVAAVSFSPLPGSGLGKKSAMAERFARVALALDELAGSRSARGRYDLSLGGLGPLGSDDFYDEPAPGGLREAAGALSMDEFVCSLEAMACAKALGFGDEPSHPGAAVAAGAPSKPRL